MSENALFDFLNFKFSLNPDDSPSGCCVVETSNNIARIVLGDGKIHVACLTRSSSESSKNDLTNALTSCFELGGFKVKLSGAYPGWQPNVDSEILKVLTNLYEILFGI